MTENEKKQIQVMHNERRRRQDAKIAAMNKVDPKAVFPDDLKNRKREIEDILDRR